MENWSIYIFFIIIYLFYKLKIIIQIRIWFNIIPISWKISFIIDFF